MSEWLTAQSNTDSGLTVFFDRGSPVPALSFVGRALLAVWVGYFGARLRPYSPILDESAHIQ